MSFCCRSRSSCCVSSRDNSLSEGDSDLRSSSDFQSPHPISVPCGLGILFCISEEGNLIIDEFISGGTAQKCGKLRIGDELVRVDGRYVKRKPASQVAQLILGPAGSIVQLTVHRNNGTSMQTVHAAVVREPPRN